MVYGYKEKTLLQQPKLEFSSQKSIRHVTQSTSPTVNEMMKNEWRRNSAFPHSSAESKLLTYASGCGQWL